MDSKQQKKISIEKYELDYLGDAENNLLAAKSALAAAKLSRAKRRLEDDVTFHSAELLMLEEFASNGVFRRACSTVIEAHEIDRNAPLHYHKPGQR